MTNDADVVVVGAGMAGLVVAHDLARAGRRVIVLDAAAEVGGLLRRGTLAGLDIDLGAESFATRTDAVAALVADAGLGLELVAPRPQGAWLAVDKTDGGARGRPPRRAVLGTPAGPGAARAGPIIGAAGGAPPPAAKPPGRSANLAGLSPAMMRAAIFATGSPITLATNGTVRDARGLTSST